MSAQEDSEFDVTAPTRCAKRGGTFRTVIRRVGVLFAAILAAWAAAMAGPASLLLLPILGGGLVYFVVRRRFVDAVAFVCLSPLAVMFTLGVIDYAHGRAKLRSMGLPGTESHNLDRQLRCGRSTGGCLVGGHEWAWLRPYNLAIRTMTACFGCMRGAYTGPYPTKDEALAALENAAVLPPADLAACRFSVGGRTIQLDEDVATLVHLQIPDIAPPQPITAALWQEDCLILRIPTPSWHEPDKPSAVIVLIACEKGRPFAYYAEGEYYHRGHPVAWERSEE
jgi:hypothetical protein